MKNILSLLVFIIYFPALSQDTERSKLVEIPYNHITPYKTPAYFNFRECRQSYFKINLTSFDINVDKKFLKKYQPVAYIKVTIGNKKMVKIIGNESIEFVNEGKDVFIRSVKNSPIVGFLPYTGEDVKISVSLYAYKTNDKIQDAIELVKDITSLFPNQLSPYFDATDKIYSKLENLISKSNFLISYEHTFNAFQDQYLPNTFKEGFYVILNENAAASGTDFHINNFDISYNGNSINSSNLDYMILNFEHAIKIPDYQKLPFYEKYNEALNYAINRNATQAVELYKNNVLVRILASDNLTNYNKKALHRYLYANLMSEISSYNSDFRIEDVPDIDCLQKTHIAYSKVEKVEDNRSQAEKDREANKEKLEKLLKDIELDQKIDYLIDHGYKQPSEIIYEENLM